MTISLLTTPHLLAPSPVTQCFAALTSLPEYTTEQGSVNAKPIVVVSLFVNDPLQKLTTALN